MLDFNEFRDDFKQLYPSYLEEQLQEVFELRVDFWKGIIENFDIFFDIDKLREEGYIK